MKEYKIRINGNEYAIKVQSIEQETATVEVNGTRYDVEIAGVQSETARKTPVISGSTTAHTGSTSRVTAATNSPSATASVVAGDIKSPLPGTVLDVMVSEGDTVTIGQHLLMLEAMKMENNIDADRDGKVLAIKARKGDSVLEGDVLITIG